MVRALIAIFALSAAGSLSAQQAPALTQLQAAAEIGQSANPGAPFEGSVARRAGVTLAPSRALDETPFQEHDTDGSPWWRDVRKAMLHEGCGGFLRCGGDALISPVMTPVRIAGAKHYATGHAFEDTMDGFSYAIGGFFLGIILAPVSLVLGIGKAFVELFEGNVV